MTMTPTPLDPRAAGGAAGTTLVDADRGLRGHLPQRARRGAGRPAAPHVIPGATQASVAPPGRSEATAAAGIACAGGEFTSAGGGRSLAGSLAGYVSRVVAAAALPPGR